VIVWLYFGMAISGDRIKEIKSQEVFSTRAACVKYMHEIEKKEPDVHAYCVEKKVRK
jgi:hypothetical protein